MVCSSSCCSATYHWRKFTVEWSRSSRARVKADPHGLFSHDASSIFHVLKYTLQKSSGGHRMKKVIVAVICAVFVFGTIATGYAEQGDWRGGIRARIQEERQKIDRGIERGTLTRHEADRLNAELGTILDKIDRMRADGYLSPGERDQINNDLDRLDRDIAREKRDGTVAPGYAERGDWRGGIRARIQEARQRIDGGIQRGTLNRKEARKLNKELDKILNKIDRMKADGRLSPKERDKINRDLDKLDRDIAREKRDDDRR